MITYWLKFELLSDATFGRGEGVAGLVDQEVEHDRNGLPYLRGRTLKGLLNEECANLLFALKPDQTEPDRWNAAAQRLWGGPGSVPGDAAHLHVGDAQLPADLRQAVQLARDAEGLALRPADVLDTLTTIRRQTAVDEETGAPDEGSLRALRAVIRRTMFESPLAFTREAEADDLALLAACVLAFRRAGTGRNRGRGRLEATLHEDEHGRPGREITPTLFQRFQQEARL
jgi:hypothetical protein